MNETKLGCLMFIVLIAIGSIIGSLTGSVILGVIIGFILCIFVGGLVTQLSQSASAPSTPIKPPLRDFGEVKEPLASGGNLVVTHQSWRIQYDFPGPDRRYNWDHFVIPSDRVSLYIMAWEHNYEEYCRLRDNSISGTEITKQGMCDMTIRVGGYHQGVCLCGWRMQIATDEDLKEILDDYRKCAARAAEIQNKLGNPGY